MARMNTPFHHAKSEINANLISVFDSKGQRVAALLDKDEKKADFIVQSCNAQNYFMDLAEYVATADFKYAANRTMAKNLAKSAIDKFKEPTQLLRYEE